MSSGRLMASCALRVEGRTIIGMPAARAAVT